MSAGRTCDTSVLVPALLSWHDAHEPCRAALTEVVAYPAHVVAEVYSVLTRLPAPHRLSDGDAIAVVGGLPGTLVTLSAAAYLPTLRRLATHGVRGGAVYDGVVAATAEEHDLVLLSRDRRARPTYETLDADVRYVS